MTKRIIPAVVVAGVALGLTGQAWADVWYDQDWLYRKEITFTSDSAKIPSTQSYFPALVKITADTDIGGACQADCDDLLFTTSDGTRLDHEIEKYEVSGGALTASVWVEVPSLSPGARMNLYYGNASCANQQRVEQTWDGGPDASPANNFKMVQHLQEATGHHLDSTWNNYDSTSETVTQQGAPIGLIAGADRFDGADDYVQCPDVSTGNWTNLTAEAWVYWTGGVQGGFAGIYYKGWTNGLGRFLIDDQFDADWVLVQNGNGNFYSGIDTVPANQWAHIAYVYDQSAGREYIFINAQVEGQQGRTGNILGNADPLLIGKGHGTTYRFPGIIDEFRVSNIARGADWLTAGYNNTNDPGRLLDAGRTTVRAGAEHSDAFGPRLGIAVGWA